MDIIEFKGKIYEIIDQSYPDNHGTDGEIVYKAHAKNEEKEYLITWATTEEWNLSCELLNLENRLNDLQDWQEQRCLNPFEEKEKKEIEERIEEIEDTGTRSFYVEDESNACDWDNPISVEEI